jgi:hypothetical protein
MRIDRLVRMGRVLELVPPEAEIPEGLERVAELGPDGLLYGDVPATRRRSEALVGDEGHTREARGIVGQRTSARRFNIGERRGGGQRPSGPIEPWLARRLCPVHLLQHAVAEETLYNDLASGPAGHDLLSTTTTEGDALICWISPSAASVHRRREEMVGLTGRSRRRLARSAGA